MLILPKEIGGFKVVQGNFGTRLVEAGDKSHFSLPKDEEVEKFFSFDNGALHLLKSKAVTHYSRMVKSSSYFLGIDEIDGTPFCAAVPDRLVSVFENEGSDNFFDELVPKTIKFLIPFCNNQIMRQGDFFALKVAESWEEIERKNKIGGYEIAPNGLKTSIFEKGGLGSRLFRTRHSLCGKGANAQIVLSKKMSKRGGFVQRTRAIFIASGVIEAPNHKPLNLDGVYIVERSAGLIDEMCGGLD